MDQTPKSTDQRRTDQNNNNNNNSIAQSACSCSNISIMQLFHEMKQEFPKVPDPIVQQLVTDNCHNRRNCIDQLRQVATSQPSTPTMYPSKSIHNNSNQQTPRSPINGVKWANNKKMREISEMFENTSISCSSSSEASTSSDSHKLKRPTTLQLRRAPDPPSSTKSTTSTSSPTSNLSKLTSTTSSLVASTTSVSSISSTSRQNQMTDQFYQNQFHHNVTLDSSAAKFNDSLNVQLNVTVSPISSAPPPVPPRPRPSARLTSQLNVQPEPPYTNMVDQKNSISPTGATSACTGTTGQRSYTSVNFTLRQPTSILPSPQTPIEIQAGPSSLTYSSSSFDAKQGYQSHLKITVAGNGESCIQAVRTKQPAGIQPDVSQIDTTINIAGSGTNGNEHPPIRITSNPNKQILPSSTDYLTEDELRQLIQKQLKQKELLECELSKEREKLEMVRFDIITLTSPVMSRTELQQLYAEISRLRFVCERLADDIEIASAPQRPTAVISSSNRLAPQRPPPPIPAALRCLSLHQNPFHSQLSPQTARLHMPPPHQPPSYNDVMRESRLAATSSLPNLVDDDDENGQISWPCSICTFQNHPLLNQCEQCDMPRLSQGIKITSHSYRPLRQNNNLQNSSSSFSTNNDNSNLDNNSNNNNASSNVEATCALIN